MSMWKVLMVIVVLCAAGCSSIPESAPAQRGVELTPRQRNAEPPAPPVARVEITIEITEIPSCGGGSDSRGNIAGRVSGVEAPQNYEIVLYAHTDRWYVQPLIDAPFTDIRRDGRWGNWTHLGMRYAALLVRPSFRPEATLQSLPDVGGDVIAKTDVPCR